VKPSGIPLNVPEEDIRVDLAAHDVHVTYTSLLTKSDKSNHPVITKYPIFIISLPPGSDTRKVLQIRKLSMHCQMGEIKKLPPSA
jgi:hypothetical protein